MCQFNNQDKKPQISAGFIRCVTFYTLCTTKIIFSIWVAYTPQNATLYPTHAVKESVHCCLSDLHRFCYPVSGKSKIQHLFYFFCISG